MRLRKKQSKCEQDNTSSKIMEQLHNQILILQTQNNVLIQTMKSMEDEIQCLKQINKIKEKNKESEIKLLKIEINSLKLKSQRVHTKLQNIQNVLDNKSIDVLHSVI